jgi:DNA ligase-1
VRLIEIVETSRVVAETKSRLKKVEQLSTCLGQLSPGEREIGISYLSGTLPQGRIGIGPALLREALAQRPSTEARLDLPSVDATLSHIAEATGPGSTAERRVLLSDLFARATQDEQEFLARLVMGEIRQGALEGIMMEALARATDVPLADVRHGVMVAGELASVAAAALATGSAGVDQFTMKVLQPVKPMLAHTADSISDALDRLGTAGFEYKLDGARVQVHKSGKEVSVFTRRQNDVTAAVPEIVEAALTLPVRDVILDGETLALHEDGTPHPFQITMRRFGRKLDVPTIRATLPLDVFFFDCLHVDGEDLIDKPAGERFAALQEMVPTGLLIPRVVTSDSAEAETFLSRALQRGHEGVMAKALDAAYEAGSRGSSWLKIKPAYTLDLAVLAAEWGHGRRRGWLSNLHLGARDPQSGQFVMLGKTFKGLTDEMLDWQTRKLQDLAVDRDEHTVYVRPKLVVEVAFNEIQSSPQYPAGLALRFARVKRYRHDKRAADVDTLDTVRAIHEGTRPRDS